MSKRIVVALGGNALGSNLPEQMEAVRGTAAAIADLIVAGNEVVIVHGNGPQVGMIANAMAELTRSDPEKYVPVPLSVCGAMSQGYIGYDLQNALREELLNRGLEKGYRRVVASPKPVSIVELATIQTLVANDHVVVCCGGGGIPVTPTEHNRLKGAAAVIDKDFAAEKLAEQLDADELVILTAVEKVAVGFGTDHERWLDTLTPQEATELADAGEFGAGSMLPKVQAACAFAQSKPGRRALITLLEKAADGIAGKTGTAILGA